MDRREGIAVIWLAILLAAVAFGPGFHTGVHAEDDVAEGEEPVASGGGGAKGSSGTDEQVIQR